MIRNLKLIAPVCALIASLASMPANAIQIGTYDLHNHPDGNQAPPLYGLRLDGLLTGSSDEEYTFDFDHASSAMTLSYDGSKIVIDGLAFGGEDNGAAYLGGTTALWTIHFEYTVGLSQPGDGGLDDVLVNAHHQNFGTLSSSFGMFDMRDHANGSGLSFQFGDEDGSGHRGFDGISGWGWLDHRASCQDVDTDSDSDSGCTGGHIKSSDWLFTASPVPVPAAVWLFGSGLLGLVGIARRKKAA